MKRRKAIITILLTLWLTGSIAHAAEGVPKPLEGVGIDQHLDETIPLSLPFRDEAGNRVTLGEYFGKRPVILAFVYYECPMLCTLVLNGLVRAMRAISLDAGKDFTVVTVSFDPRETPELAAQKKRIYLETYGRKGADAGWHFLTGSTDSIERLTKAAGFRYRYDPKTKQFAHAAGIMVLTPQGRLAKYFYGVEYSPRDLRLALVEAASERIGTLADRVLLWCYHYDPAEGRYSLRIMRSIRLLGSATVLVIGLVVARFILRERKEKSGSR